MTEPVILIPARWGASRFPGKPLQPLRGPDGAKSLIRRSWEAACRAAPAQRVHICTDDDRIEDAARGFGAQVIRTSSTCRNGTERCAEAVRAAGLDAQIVVNLQGDAPLTPAQAVAEITRALMRNPHAAMATPVLPCDSRTWQALIADRAAGRVGGTTAVMGADGRALYFSKEVLPHGARGHLHLGVYAYRRAALLAYPGWGETPLERAEGLEQLRFLERGEIIQCVPITPPDWRLWELNNPSDIPVIEAELEHLPHA